MKTKRKTSSKRAAPLKLKNPPIVEAVVDIDCALPSTHQLAALADRARERLAREYPKAQQQLMQGVKVEGNSAGMQSLAVQSMLQSLLYLHDDEKQLVQFRAQGYSFNRLAPYGSLDDYLPEVERTWGIYRELAAPLEVRAVRLRFINRIVLPLDGGTLALEHYVKVASESPDPNTLAMAGLLVQQALVDRTTRHEANLVVATQPIADASMPVIIDITVAAPVTFEPGDWKSIRGTLGELRILKNHLFRSTLTKPCLNRFR